jgi:vitamin-K-epoxide reductase (warfarin-sensitive)
MKLSGDTLLRYIFIILALAGIIVSGLALHEHYRTEGIAPCSINDKWDCGVVNKSDYSMIWKIPVGAVGVAGYLLLGVLGGLRWYRLLTIATFGALSFSLYLTYVEAKILETYCIYCVISLGIICAFTLLAIGTVSFNFYKARSNAA